MFNIMGFISTKVKHIPMGCKYFVLVFCSLFFSVSANFECTSTRLASCADCVDTCEKPANLFLNCPFECLFCLCLGRVRDSSTGKCIPLSQCKCPRYEKNADCTQSCQPTCQNPTPLPTLPCNVNCTKNCTCIDGYLRDEFTKACVLKEKCLKCPDRENYVGCDPPCEPTCYKPKIDPDDTCVGGCAACVCKTGYIRSDDSASCIFPFECPKCPFNEKLVKCINGCQPTCQNRNPNPDNCTASCINCTCKDGYIRNEFTGSCVLLDDCPKCPKNEIYFILGQCESTCQNLFPTCSMSQLVNCSCEIGYVRNATGGSCIPRWQCP